jgi:hypothetical protein
MLVECMREDEPLIPGRRSVTASSKSISGVESTIWRRKRSKRGEPMNPGNKYPHYFVTQPAMMTRNWKEAKVLLDEARRLLPAEPLIVSLQGVFYVLTRKIEPALECLTRACASAKSFGHVHHTYYQVACILALLGRPEAAFERLERSVSTGFVCWPFFVKDAGLEKAARGLPEFEVLVSSFQAKYPDHLGLL